MKMLTADFIKRFMSNKINCGYLLIICKWISWVQIWKKDWWMTRWAADFCSKSVYKKVKQGIDQS